MSDRDRIVQELADTVGRLVDGWYHVEQLDGDRRYHRWVPGLLEQLREQLVESTEADSEGPRSIPDSRPPVPEEPFNVLLAFHHQAAAWQRDLGLPRASSVESIMRSVVGHAASAGDDVLGSVLADASMLRHRAEVVLSWELRSRRIRGRCPACERNGTILVRLDSHGPTNAYCIGCQAAWEREKLGLLAGAMGVTP